MSNPFKRLVVEHCPFCNERVLMTPLGPKKHARICPVLIERSAKARIAAQIAEERKQLAKPIQASAKGVD